MGLIDVGPGATNRASTSTTTGYTNLLRGNPANDTGKLTSFEVWANSDLSGVKIGTFYGSGTSWTSRDVESIGNVTAGSKQTFTGKDCDVQTGDIIGAYRTGGNMERDTSGGDGAAYKSGDQFGAGTQTYTDSPGVADSYYATGATLLPFNRHDMNGGFNPLNGGMQ